MSVSTDDLGLRRVELTAVEATRPINAVVAVSKSTAKTCAVAPHHLREVTPCCIEVWVVVVVLGLLFVPAVRGSAGKLDPSVVTVRRWVHGREVTAGAFLFM